MKIQSLIIAFIILCTCTLSAEKYSLVIAIGDYPEEGGWPDISSQNDVVHINAALKILGFKSENIRTLFDEEATKEGIVNSIKELTKKLKKGDIVYIHFSGHGQQVLDDNGDEIDNLDEAIVPFNSFIDYVEGYNEGQNLIRDDLLGSLTNEIRTKCGKTGQLILILDSCHSGTGTRGLGKARGTDKIMAPNNISSAKSRGEKNMGINTINNPNLAPMASFFGASSGELNFETLDEQSNPVGSLSYSVASVLATMKSTFSFEELFDRIKLKMKTLAPRQNPQWEGPADAYIFGGSLGERQNFYTVKKQISSTQVIAEIGTINNIYANAKVEVHSIDQEKVLAEGIVSKAGLMESIIDLEDALELSDGELIKIKVTENCEPPIKCNISFSIDEKSEWASYVNDIRNAAFVHEVDENAELYFTEKDKNLLLTTKEGDVILNEPFDKERSRNYSIKIKKRVNAYVQGKILRSYDNSDSSLKFDLEILETDCTSDKAAEDKSMSKESLSLSVGTCIKFKISNIGNKKAYFSLIDIQPDNVVNLVIPATDLGYTASEYFLEPGESYTTDYSIEIGEPYGDETLKLISSSEPLDLSGIIQDSGNASSRGTGFPLVNRSPFESLLSSTYLNSSTRGARVKKASSEEIGTKTVYFKIIK